MQPAVLALLVSVALDALLGDPPNNLHPVALMGGFIRRGTQRAEGGKARLFATGAAVLLAGCLLFSLPWLAVQLLIKGLPWWLQGIILGIALKPTFALRRLLEAGGSVRRAIEQGHLPEARRLLSWHLVSRQTGSLSAGLVCSATIESLAENLTDGFVAPLLCFSVGGLPLAWAYRFVNTADSMIGFHTPRYEYLGKASARADDVLNFIPARLTALLLVVSAFLCRMRGRAAWTTMCAHHRRTASPNAGWTMAAAAGALGTRLEKGGFYVLDGGERLPDCRDVRCAARLVLVAAALGCVLCGGIAYGIKSLF